MIVPIEKLDVNILTAFVFYIYPITGKFSENGVLGGISSDGFPAFIFMYIVQC